MSLYPLTNKISEGCLNFPYWEVGVTLEKTALWSDCEFPWCWLLGKGLPGKMEVKCELPLIDGDDWSSCCFPACSSLFVLNRSQDEESAKIWMRFCCSCAQPITKKILSLPIKAKVLTFLAGAYFFLISYCPLSLRKACLLGMANQTSSCLRVFALANSLPRILFLKYLYLLYFLQLYSKSHT